MLLSVIIIVAGAFLLFGAYLYFRQDRMVFCPTTELADTPSSLGLSFEEVYVLSLIHISEPTRPY